ncbi:hypothetical protein H5410_051338 [Solanum commersonii]|uniref:Uncharacterized protein n=1 Tax=Solanum commersonii TaxID=4109 RepID=A0A9J5WZA1_SOLCO|nr:hypothetical protein H5410_051338 [Solanum commersonii]
MLAYFTHNSMPSLHWMNHKYTLINTHYRNNDLQSGLDLASVMGLGCHRALLCWKLLLNRYILKKENIYKGYISNGIWLSLVLKREVDSQNVTLIKVFFLTSKHECCYLLDHCKELKFNATIVNFSNVEFQRGLDEWRQTQPTSKASSTTQLSSSDITSIWTNVAGGVKKDRVYGLGVQPSSFYPSPLFSSASTSKFSVEMEEMQR